MILSLHGKDPAGARALIHLEVDPALVAAGTALDEEVEQVLGRYGLLRAREGGAR
jgi:hypothetical protein